MNNQVFLKIWVASILIVSSVGGILVYQYHTSNKKLALSEEEIVRQENMDKKEQISEEMDKTPEELPDANETGVTEKTLPKPKEDIKDEEEDIENKGEGLNLVTTKLAVIPGKLPAMLEGAVYVIEGTDDVVTVPSFSPDGRKVAFVYVTIKVAAPSFSSDGLMHAKIKDPECFVVVNGEEGKKYDEISGSSPFKFPLFSPDSSQIVYRAKKDEKEFVVVNDQEGKKYDEISDPIFSPDSSKMGYRAKNNEEEFVVVNGKEKKAYYLVFSPMFSPDSSRMAHWAMTEHEGREFIVVDGKEGKKYDQVRGIKFSPDSNKVSYLVYEGQYGYQKCFTVVNGAEGKIYDHISSSPIFSPDSSRIAYCARKDGKGFVVVDGKEGKKYDKVSSLKFSSDSKKVFYMAENNEKMFIVVNGKEEKAYDRITFNSLAISPDGNKIVYQAREDVIREGEKMTREDRKWFVVVNSEEEEINEYAYNSFIFSPDDSKVASIGVSGDGKYLVAVNHKEGKKYDYVSSLIFSDDGKYICYGARINNELWWIADKVESYND